MKCPHHACISNDFPVSIEESIKKLFSKSITNTINFRTERLSGNLLSITLKTFNHNLKAHKTSTLKKIDREPTPKSKTEITA